MRLRLPFKTQPVIVGCYWLFWMDCPLQCIQDKRVRLKGLGKTSWGGGSRTYMKQNKKRYVIYDLSKIYQKFLKLFSHIVAVILSLLFWFLEWGKISYWPDIFTFSPNCGSFKEKLSYNTNTFTPCYKRIINSLWLELICVGVPVTWLLFETLMLSFNMLPIGESFSFFQFIQSSLSVDAFCLICIFLIPYVDYPIPKIYVKLPSVFLLEHLLYSNNAFSRVFGRG